MIFIWNRFVQSNMPYVVMAATDGSIDYARLKFPDPCTWQQWEERGLLHGIFGTALNHYLLETPVPFQSLTLSLLDLRFMLMFIVSFNYSGWTNHKQCSSVAWGQRPWHVQQPFCRQERISLWLEIVITFMQLADSKLPYKVKVSAEVNKNHSVSSFHV